VKNFVPRPYQTLAHEMIVESFKAKLKTLLLMSTGAGKSKLLVSFIKKYLDHYNWVIVVRKRDLVNQLAETFSEFDLEYGVFMANDSRYDSTKSIQVCSIDTLNARDTLPFIFDTKDIVLVIDEADESNAESYQNIITRYTKRNSHTRPASFSTEQLMKPMRDAFLLGLTATAFDVGLPHFDTVIEQEKTLLFLF